MFFAQPDIVAATLWAVAVLAVLFTCLPMLLALLGFSRVRLIAVSGPEAAEPKQDDPLYADLFERLRDLGFEPVGARVETAWFHLWCWRRRSQTGYVLATRGRDCFVSLYRLYVGDPWRVCFATVLTDGTLVTTANQMERLRIDRPGYFRRGYVTQDLPELLRLHRDAVDDFRARGRDVATPDVPEYYQIVAERTEDFLRAGGKGQAFKCLQSALVALFFPPILVGVGVGFHHWAVPAAAVVGAVLFRLLMPNTIRSGAEQIRQQEQESGLATRWARARRMQGLGRAAGRGVVRGDGYLPSDQPEPSPETIQRDPPTRPPTDLTWPPPS